MRKALIGGIGNVLLGDDSIGPYVVRILESTYAFDESVEIIDLGTPALDLTHQIVGLKALILVDSVASDDPAGTLALYTKEEILQDTPAQRLDPHSRRAFRVPDDRRDAGCNAAERAAGGNLGQMLRARTPVKRSGPSGSGPSH